MGMRIDCSRTAGAVGWFLALGLMAGSDRHAAADIILHPHGPGWTTAEGDGNIGTQTVIHRHPAPGGREEGDAAHQHYIGTGGAINPALPFPGPAGAAQPFNVFGVWLQRQAFIDLTAPFTSDAEYQANRVGHSFMEPQDYPRFRFVDAAMPAAARSRVEEAFGLWGGIRARVSPTDRGGTGAGLQTGIGFLPTTGDAYEIEVRWRNIDDMANGGAVHIQEADPPGNLPPMGGFFPRVYVEFDSMQGANPFPWDFTADAGASDLTMNHFMSVALHELGHLMFLLHSPTRDTDLMEPPVGLPLGNNVGNVSYRWSGYVDNPGENDAFTGLRFNRLTAGAMGMVGNTAIFDFDSPDAIKSLYSVPIPEPGSVVLFVLGGLGLGVFARRGRAKPARKSD